MTCCVCAVELGGGELQPPEPTTGEHCIAIRSTVIYGFITDDARTSTPETSPVPVEAPPPAPPPPPIGPVHHYRSSPRPPVPPPPPGLPSAAIRGPPPLPSIVPPAPLVPPRNIPRPTGANLPPAISRLTPPPPAPPPPPMARSPTPPMVTMLIEMGFDRPVARIAVERCENFDDTRPPDENIDVLLNWILDNPDAVADEERRY